uniref:RCK C-terminal domain-containing protein n=1 Tax=Dunaliella tertiolecta TaxID=3047 RepID=A0A7S3R255_DUNTE|eukprot:CAMPEP_0202371012 /NCGR_PEP_ID=MMETSP1127-20130417/2497_1 /ASSEMBLY_ACC=CAM_ASM_000462 /TAXON_ID=3047 /ORGANISM="Dunaliella tertiolecta, Strain CCMP1320" /LENGTH=1022 /DNA_ID=CAMNT_0048967109 /DNA_START=236 /DNA_END=3304 /DNA_ORIENTATION=+
MEDPGTDFLALSGRGLAAELSFTRPKLGGEGIAVIVMLAASLFIMAFDWVKPDINFMTLMSLFVGARFITLEEATVGFGNTGVLAVMALFAVAEGVSQTGGLERVIGLATGKATSHVDVLIRMLLPVMVASAFLNNTPIVALMIPIILSWSRRLGKDPKPFLVCLSYTAILGGTTTLIGTSTNLVIAGLQQERFPNDPELSNFGIFDISVYGIAYAAWGYTFLLLFSKPILQASNGKNKEARREELLVGLQIPSASKYTGMSVAKAGLRGLDGLFLVSVNRNGETIHAVGPEFVLQEGDVLSFAGDLAKVETLSRQSGLPVVSSEMEADVEDLGPRLVQQEAGSLAHHSVRSHKSVHAHNELDEREIPVRATSYGSEHAPLLSSSTPAGPSRFLRCFVKQDAPISNTTIRDIGFRSRFGAAVVAVMRERPLTLIDKLAGKFRQPKRERVEGRLGDIALQPGDELLLDIGSDFDFRSPDVTGNFAHMDRVDNSDDKQFLSAFYVVPKGAVDGKSVRQAGLRGMNGIFLAYVDCADGTPLHAVPPDTVLRGGDVLWFAGDVHGVTFLLRMPGLRHYERKHVEKAGLDILERRLVQVVVAPQSPLVGQSVRDSQFRSKYKAAIVAVQRRGERLKQKIGDIVLQPADVLLLDAGDEFMQHHLHSKAFALASEVPKSSPMKKKKMWLALGLFLGMIAVQIAQSFVVKTGRDFYPLWPASVVTASLMILTGCMTGNQARQSMDWTVYMTIAAAFGVSKATQNTGVAQNIAWLFMKISISIGGKVPIYSSLYIVTSLLSEILTNNAAAALMYPIAAIAAEGLGVPPKMVGIALMLGASSSFMSPYGYQTNLMVFNAGNLKALDLVKMGLPLTLWQWFGATIILGLNEHVDAILGAAIGLCAVVGIGGLMSVYGTGCFQRKKVGEDGQDGDGDEPNYRDRRPLSQTSHLRSLTARCWAPFTKFAQSRPIAKAGAVLSSLHRSATNSAAAPEAKDERSATELHVRSAVSADRTYSNPLATESTLTNPTPTP